MCEIPEWLVLCGQQSGQVGCPDTGIAAALNFTCTFTLSLVLHHCSTQTTQRVNLRSFSSEIQEETKGQSPHIVEWSLLFHNHWWPHCGLSNASLVTGVFTLHTAWLFKRSSPLIPHIEMSVVVLCFCPRSLSGVVKTHILSMETSVL